MTANAPETKDNNFTWKDFQERNNSELVAVYGNFVNRALQLTKKYWGGVVPACGELQEVDEKAIAEFKDVKEKVEQYLNVFKFREAQKEAMNLARIGNRYITECEPWKVWKTDPKRVETILNISLQLVANLAIAFEPFLPFSSEKLRKMINMPNFEWTQLGSTDLLKAGTQLGEPELLFEKIEDEVIERQLQKLADTKKANEAKYAKRASKRKRNSQKMVALGKGVPSMDEAAQHILNLLDTWGYKFESGAHNEYVLHFGKVCVRYGIDKEEAMTYAKSNFSSDYPDADSVMKSCYKHTEKLGT